MLSNKEPKDTSRVRVYEYRSKLRTRNTASFTGNTCQCITTVLVTLLHLLCGGLNHRTLQLLFSNQQCARDLKP